MKKKKRKKSTSDRMFNSDERVFYNSDEDTEDASESEMPKYDYDYSAAPAGPPPTMNSNHNPAFNHHHHNQHHQQHHHHLQHHPHSTNATTMNNNNNNQNSFTELREQMYIDKLNNLREQLFQLDAGIHPEFLRQLKRVEAQRQDRMLLNEAFQIYETDRVEREYVNEKKAALREFEDRKIELRESLILELEDRRRMIENERLSMELLSDCADHKPVTTRKLRRRPNEPIPVPDKRRRTSPAQLNHQLDDKDIQEDLKAILKAQSGKKPKVS